MNRIKKHIIDNKYIYITFLVASIIVSGIYTYCKIAPFGNNSMLDVDFYHQYGPLLNELYDRLVDGKSLLYSFNTGGGIPFYRNFLNYLSSPFNILLLLFKKENIVMAFSIIIGLKSCLAATTMSYYLKKTFKKDNILLVVFSILYAFCGYFCSYYWNIMWLDGMIFLPLIMCGINKIVDDDKPVFYCISLSIMLFANYFIGYMICIFSVLYFIGYLWYRTGFKSKKIFKKILLFMIFSILGAGLVAFALLPLYSALSSISATSDNFPTFELTINFIQFLFNHISGVTRTVFASDDLPLPNVYCGMITLVGLLLFFINKKINLKAKVLALLAIIFFYFSFSCNQLDFIWHAFHVPNDLPWRYSFIYSFILIIVGYYSFLRIKDIKKDTIFISFAVTILFVLSAYKFKFVNTNFNKTIMCTIYLLMYALCYLLFTLNKKSKKIASILVVLIVIAECSCSICINWNIDHDISTFMSNKKDYTNLIKQINENDNGLYRIEKTDYLTLNDPAWYNYRGISTFSSMAYESVSSFQRNIGLAGNNINSYYYRFYNTPIYNTMFNVKYILGDYIDNNYYSLIDNNSSAYLSRYNYSSSLAYGINSDIKNYKLETYMPFINQRNFVSLSTGVNNIFEGVSVKNVENASIYEESFKYNSNGQFNYNLTSDSNEMTFVLDNPKEQNVYLYVGGANVSSFEVDSSYYYITSDEYYILDIGKKSAGEIRIKIKLKNSGDSNIFFSAYSINNTKFKEFYNKIKENLLNVEQYSDTYIKGKANINNDMTMFTTIAYDDGWGVYVDKSKVDTYKVADSFLAFDIKKGKHDIKLAYYPKYMREGIIISFISLLIISIYMYKTKK